MSRHTARLVLDQFNMRPALIAPRYVRETPLAFAREGAALPEVSGTGLLGDIRELANAHAEREIAQQQLRRRELAAVYGYTTPQDEKPFAFADGKAIIPVHGILINRFAYSWSFATGYNFIRAQVEAALEDEDVDGLIYDVNSYGGTVAGCKETADLMFSASAKAGGKPSLAVVDSSCFSAAYMLASAADRIAVTPTGGAGSIGVVLMHMDVSQALEKFGLKVTFLTSPEGGHKVDGNPFEPLSKEVAADLQAEIDKMYGVFVATVVRNRPRLSDQAVRDTQARCFLADDALGLGLIDQVATPPEALNDYFNGEIEGDTNGPVEDPDDEEEGDDEDVDDALDDDDKRLSTEGDDSMTTQQNAPKGNPPNTGSSAKPAAAGTAANAARSGESAADNAAAVAAAVTAERERVKAILDHPDAEGRAGLAQHLALHTDNTVDAAAGILKATPKQAAAVPAATGEANHFANAMNNGQHPNVGSGEGGAAGGEAKPSRAEQILAAQRRMTGVRRQDNGARK